MADQTVSHSPDPRPKTVAEAKFALREAGSSIDYWQGVKQHPLLAVGLAATLGALLGSKHLFLQRLALPPALLDAGLLFLRHFMETSFK